MTHPRLRALMCAASLCWAACAPTTTPDAGAGSDAGEPLINPPTDSGIPDVDTGACPDEGPFIRHEASGASTRTTVTACSGERWVGLDLETKTEVLVDDATDTGAWDLAFQRFHVMSNGGVSGAGGVRVAPLTGVSFDEVTEAPESGWLEDQPDSDLDGYADFVISGQDLSWWEYDLETHVIHMTGVVWVIETVESSYVKLELVDYYADIDGSATSGYPTFVWQIIDPPGGAGDGGPSEDGGDADAG